MDPSTDNNTIDKTSPFQDRLIMMYECRTIIPIPPVNLINGHKTTISGRPYVEYNTAIATVDGPRPAAIVRIWQKPGALLSVNNTCMLTLTKISITRDDMPWGTQMTNNALPDFPVPVMILTVVTYTLCACFDPTSPKWTKVPVPNVGNNVFVVGHIRGVYNNTLHLDVTGITLTYCCRNSPSTDELQPKSPTVKNIRFGMPPPMVNATDTANGVNVSNNTLGDDGGTLAMKR
ncbi:hypothetical protein K435DRAFT_857400 [Dendrothele bispora CBS 962.96]|uniref:Uncharacterized protein n=1 Tax=Dendrothele bispora (strain CBS 962.96) TaxID=1314807 RepID=A0A4S8M731_DENBC|nr:hypothetical protein K435DRAFT_857400 [Dendrothele bispora CBS 962.96]